jgi:hypothetical protein
MSNRIPPSLKWLIDKRARLDGEVVSLEKLIAQFEHLSARFCKLESLMNRVQASIKKIDETRANLAAIDRALALHHIKVDPENISPIQHRDGRYPGLPYGILTKLLLTRLKQKKGVDVSTDELTSYVADHAHDLGLEAYDNIKVRQSVRYRLKGLAIAGVIERGTPMRFGKRYRTTWCLPK